MEAVKAQTRHRYKSIDGMRGIAALAVVFFHLSLNMKSELSQLFPDVVNLIFSYGYLGVPIFFVISGFVISLSIGDSQITPKYAGTFILRRSIRLDFTYWASIAFAIVLLNIKNQVLNGAEPTPSFLHVAAHMFYLQDLLSIKPVISVVYWTLCLEVQLYLFYIVSIWVSQIFSSRFSYSTYITHALLITLIGVLSLLVEFQVIKLNIPGLFIGNWHYFLMGVLVSNVVRKLPYSLQIFISWLIIELIFQASLDLKPYAVTGILTTVSVFYLWRHNLLNTFLTGSIFQYFGKISYTLYLVHPDVGWKVISFGELMLRDKMSPVLAGLLFFAGIITSIIVAHLFHVAFEKPSLWLVSRLKMVSIKEALNEMYTLIYRYIKYPFSAKKDY